MAIEPLPLSLLEIAERAKREVDLLTREIGEIELLVQQARAEASRHEQKRVQTVDKLRTLPSVGKEGEVSDLNEQLVAVTRRSAIMESQVDVLEGKLKILGRFRESLRHYGTELDGASLGGAMPQQTTDRLDANAPLPAAVSRLIQAAQEDLRREIARAMHDGPAQSLTNIVLQAQIVERLLDRDPTAVKSEIGELVAMVQRTLEATKTFIFDIRPMVLDDLGLVPTLRRVARERGRRAQIPIEFESYGPDGRLPMDVETAFFRIIDEIVTGYLSSRPDLISIRLEWSDKLEARVVARREGEAEALVVEEDVEATEPGAPTSSRRGRTPERELPDALKAMIDEQLAGSARAAKKGQLLSLPANTWREVQQRAETISCTAELADEGREVILVRANR
ncbi:MAG TPA: histidine kinase [Candidatus Limnocylindrales bacterium]